MRPGKRKHYRLAVEAPCVVKIITGGPQPQTSSAFKGMVKDVSAAGLLVNTDTLRDGAVAIFPELEKPGASRPKPNTLLIKFSLPNEQDPFVAYCEPRWYDNADLSDPYEYQIGSRIIRLRRRDMERLQKYLHKYGQGEDTQEYQRRYNIDAAGEKFDKAEYSKFYDAVLPLRYRIVSAKDGSRSNLSRTTTHQISLSGVNAEVPTMSVDGIDMVFDDTPTLRNSLELEITLPGQVRSVTATGEVHLAERFPSRDGYKYFVGIRFRKIPPRDLSALARFIKGKPAAENLAEKPR